jgi:hypothetical protein
MFANIVPMSREDKKAGCAYAARNAGAGYNIPSQMSHDVGGAHQVRL